MLAQVGFSTTEVIGIVSALLGALVGAVVFLHRLLMAAKDKELERSNALLLALTEKLEEAVDKKRRRDGKPPFKRLAAVKPNSNSPPTKAQENAADKETLKARIAAAVLGLGLEPIDDPELPKVVAADEVELVGVAKITKDGAVKVKAESKAEKGENP